jgi:multimeric flavodoxin WrbA
MPAAAPVARRRPQRDRIRAPRALPQKARRRRRGDRPDRAGSPPKPSIRRSRRGCECCAASSDADAFVAAAPGRRLLIVWWSDTGGTAQLVDAAAAGAVRSGAALEADAERSGQSARAALGTAEAHGAHRVQGVQTGDRGDAAATDAAGPGPFEVFACRCDRVSAAALLRADALLFATPECLGSMAGPMKTFFDRCYYPAFDRLAGRPYATIVCAGSDGLGAIRQIDRIATGWRLKRVADPLRVITGAQTPDTILAPKKIDASKLSAAAELGATLAAGTVLGIW